MGIPIGKLALYTAAGGVDPKKVLPVMLDTGTDNVSLQQDPFYLGMQHPRLEKSEFWSMMDEFMRAVRNRWPHALVQFEDFSSDRAAHILQAYRLKQLCFNDDIQGTGAVVLAGALSACAMANVPLKDQRIVVLGAGSAGLGVSTTLLQGMIQEGLSADEAKSRFYLVDARGLISTSRDESLSPGQRFFARRDLPDRLSLEELIATVKPTMLLGLSACAGAFTEVCVREMAKHVDRPIVFPLSNPTSVAECTATQAIEWTSGRAIFASGSPFDPVSYEGRVFPVSQCNNMFIFPGLGQAAILCRASRVTDRMLYSAARALAQCVSEEERASGQIFPSVQNIRHVSIQVTTAVMRTALEDGTATVKPDIRRGARLEDYVESRMFDPYYHALV